MQLCTQAIMHLGHVACMHAGVLLVHQVCTGGKTHVRPAPCRSMHACMPRARAERGHCRTHSVARCLFYGGEPRSPAMTCSQVVVCRPCIHAQCALHTRNSVINSQHVHEQRRCSLYNHAKPKHQPPAWRAASQGGGRVRAQWQGSRSRRLGCTSPRCTSPPLTGCCYC